MSHSIIWPKKGTNTRPDVTTARDYNRRVLCRKVQFAGRRGQVSSRLLPSTREPVRPADQDGLEWQAEPQKSGAEGWEQVRVQRHVQVRREHGHEEGDESPRCRDLPFWAQKQDAQNDLRQAARVNQLEMPGQ